VRVSLRLINSTVTDFDPALSACPRCHYPSDQPHLGACMSWCECVTAWFYFCLVELVCVHARAL
jgi:hypothetical protein